MRHRSDDYRHSAPFEAVMKYLGLVMSLVYVVVGIAVAWKAKEVLSIPPRLAVILGSVMILYGLFRGYGVYRKYFKHE